MGSTGQSLLAWTFSPLPFLKPVKIEVLVINSQFALTQHEFLKKFPGTHASGLEVEVE